MSDQDPTEQLRPRSPQFGAYSLGAPIALTGRSELVKATHPTHGAVIIKRLLPSLLEGGIGASGGTAVLPNVVGSGPIEGRLRLGFGELLFDDVGTPPRDPGNRKDRSEEVGIDPHGVVDGSAEQQIVGADGACRDDEAQRQGTMGLLVSPPACDMLANPM